MVRINSKQMGPFYGNGFRISYSPLFGEEITQLLQKQAVERVQDPGTRDFYSRIFLVPKKNGKLCPVIDLSLLDQYIEKQPLKMETVKSVWQLILVNDWADSIDRTDAYQLVPIHPHSRKYLHFMFENQVFQFTALSFGMSLSVDFYQTDGRSQGSFAWTFHLTFSIPRRLALKRSNMQLTYMSHNILPTDSWKSRVHSKLKVKFDTSSAIHLHRNGISDTTEYSQGTTRSHRTPTSDYQTISNLDSSYSTNFPFSFGQTQYSSRQFF